MAKFKIFCGDCQARYERHMVAEPKLCTICGSDFLAVKELAEGPEPDIIARVRKLCTDGLGAESLKVAFGLDSQTFDDIIAGKYGKGSLSPHYVSISDDIATWIDDQRKRKVMP